MKFEKISADEAHSKREGVINKAGVMAKGVPMVPDVAKATKFDTEKREASFVMSAEVSDRMGDIVVQEGLDTTNFLANPQALLFHNSRSWPIGSWKDVTKNLTGRPKRTEGVMELLPEGDDPDADRAARHIAAGTMRTVSIGFRVDWDAVESIRSDDGDWLGLRFLRSELLECSLVPIPALPAATMKELTTGMLSAESIEAIKGVLETFALKDDGSVVDRETLETVVREAEGNRTHHVVRTGEVMGFLQKAKLEDVAGKMKAGDFLVKLDDGEFDFLAKAPDEPKDGEEVPVQPDPADDEKTKTAADLVLDSLQPGQTVIKNADGTITMRDKDGNAIGGIVPSHVQPVEIFVRGDHVAIRERLSVEGVDFKNLSIHPLGTLADDEAMIEIAETVRAKAKHDGAADGFMVKLLKSVLPFGRKTTETEESSPTVDVEERRQAAIARAAALTTEADRAAA